MKEIFIGEEIKRCRENLGISQIDLSAGICDVTTLSRLENGQQTPSRKVVKNLLSRLGEPDDRFYAYITGKEAQIETDTKDITSLIIEYENSVGEDKNKKKEEILNKIDDFEKLISKDDSISRQFIERTKVIVGNKEGDYSAEEKIALLEHAIRLTYPKFDMTKIEKGYFSYDEVIIISQLANEYCENNQINIATEILRQLLTNIENRFKKISSGWNRKSLVQYNLARCLLIEDNVKEASEYAESGKNVCIEHNTYNLLPGFYIILAECCYRQGDMLKSKELFIEAYYLCKAIKQESNLEIARKYLKEYFEIFVD